VSRGFGLSAEAFAVGVGVGSGADIGAGVDFRARRPDCAMSVDAQVKTKTTAEPAARARNSGE